MRPEAFERVEVTAGPEMLPFRSVQDAATAPSLMRLTLFSCLAVIGVVPQLGLAGFALTSPDIRLIILERPMVAVQLAVGMVFWLALFAWPLRSLFARLTWRRTVEISRHEVSVADTRSFGNTVWTAPLRSYKGVAHHIRSSMSGTRHELVLVHDDAKRSVLLMTAPVIADADIARMTRLLDLPQITAAEMYGLRNNNKLPKRRLLAALSGVTAGHRFAEI